jgi:hypothetical protein
VGGDADLQATDLLLAHNKSVNPRNRVCAFPVENAQNNSSFMRDRQTSGKVRQQDAERCGFGAKIYLDKSERAFPRRGVSFGMASRPGAALLVASGHIKL